MILDALLGGLIGKAIDAVGGVVDELIIDKDKAAELKARMHTEITGLVASVLEVAKAEIEAAKSTITAEAQGESAVQRNWRPHLMYLLMFMIVFNAVFVPLLFAFTGITIPVIDAMEGVSDNMWDVIKIGLGGYIGGKTLEKVAASIAPAIGKINDNGNANK